MDSTETHRCAGLGDVAAGAGHAQIAERFAGLEVADRDDVYALPVASAGREPGVVEDPFEHVVG